jgi:hypothetical protein
MTGRGIPGLPPAITRSDAGMWMVAELGFALWLVLGCWWLLRQGPAGCVRTMTGLALAYVAAFAAAWVGDLALGSFATNLWLRLALAGTGGSLAFLLVIRWWRRRSLGTHARWAAALDGRLRGRLVAGTAQAAWVAGNLLAWIVGANLLVTAVPAARDSARSGSLVTASLLGAAPGAAWRQDLDEQQRRLRGLAGGVDHLLAATGTRRMMELMDAVAWIAGLDHMEFARLIDVNPELRRLADEPAMLALIDDARLMRQVDEALQGSLPAVYALGAEPAVIALIDNPTMRAAMRAVDPVALRLSSARGTPGGGVAWELGQLDSSLGLDERLAAADGWTAKAGGGYLAWEEGARFGVARAQLAAVAGPRRLHIVTAAPFSCWFAGRLLRPEGSPPRREVALPAGAGEFVLLLDFAGVPQPRLCLLK